MYRLTIDVEYDGDVSGWDVPGVLRDLADVAASDGLLTSGMGDAAVLEWSSHAEELTPPVEGVASLGFDPVDFDLRHGLAHLRDEIDKREERGENCRRLAYVADFIERGQAKAMERRKALEWLIDHPEVMVRHSRPHGYVAVDQNDGLAVLCHGDDYQTVICDAMAILEEQGR